LKSERSIGSLMRAFEFEDEVDHGSLKAELVNGLLSVVVDKKGKGKVCRLLSR
jgi:HSP20 family molecular chaperone IbpA